MPKSNNSPLDIRCVTWHENKLNEKEITAFLKFVRDNNWLLSEEAHSLLLFYFTLKEEKWWSRLVKFEHFIGYCASKWSHQTAKWIYFQGHFLVEVALSKSYLGSEYTVLWGCVSRPHTKLCLNAGCGGEVGKAEPTIQPPQLRGYFSRLNIT